MSKTVLWVVGVLVVLAAVVVGVYYSNTVPGFMSIGDPNTIENGGVGLPPAPAAQ